MKATDFANYFDFSIELIPWNEVPEDDKAYLAKQTEIYAVSDDQGVFHTRYINNILDLADCFDSMLNDYILNDIEEYGFEPNPQENDWEQALKWMKEDNKEFWKWKIAIVECLLDPNLIEDDVETEDDEDD